MKKSRAGGELQPGGDGAGAAGLIAAIGAAGIGGKEALIERHLMARKTRAGFDGATYHAMAGESAAPRSSPAFHASAIRQHEQWLFAHSLEAGHLPAETTTR